MRKLLEKGKQLIKKLEDTYDKKKEKDKDKKEKD